jgi:hypothetical protein
MQEHQMRSTIADLAAENDRINRKNATLRAENELLRLGKNLPEPVPTINLVHVQTINDYGSPRFETMTEKLLHKEEFDSARIHCTGIDGSNGSHTVLFKLREPDDDERINQRGVSTLMSAQDFRIKIYPKAGKIVPIGPVHIILKRVLDIPYFWPSPQAIRDGSHLEQHCAEIFPDKVLHKDYYVVTDWGRVYFAAPDVKLVIHAKMSVL